MANYEKSYRPAPSNDIAGPPEGPIGLGSILSKRNGLKRPLNPDTRKHVDKEFPPDVKTDWVVTSEQIRSKSGGVWTTFLANFLNLGADAKASRETDEKFVVHCDKMTTYQFQPRRTYIFDSLQDEDVRDWGKLLLWNKPVYMVTGLMVAEGIKMKSLEQYKWELEAQIKADGKSQGGPAEAGVDMKLKSLKLLKIQWNKAGNFIFAYSLIKIKRKKDGTHTERDDNKGALFDDDEPSLKDEEGLDAVENMDEFWDIKDVDPDEDDGDDE